MTSRRPNVLRRDPDAFVLPARPVAWLLVAVLSPAAVAHAQPCGQTEERPVPAPVLDRFIRDVRGALAVVRDARQRPSARLGAARRAVDLVREVRGRYGLCDRPARADDARARAALGAGLSDPRLEQGVWEACVDAIAETHAAGPAARACLSQVERSRAATGFAGPAPPRAWAALDADAASAVFARMTASLALHPGDRAQILEVAAVQVATADFDGALDTLAPLGDHDLDGLLLEGAARSGRAEKVEATLRFREASRIDPSRPEPHLDVALAVLARRFDADGPTQAEVDAAFDHARAHRCLLGPTIEPALADEATEVIRALDEQLHGDTAWGYHGQAPPLPLPWALLGRQAQELFSPSTPARSTCAEVLARVRRPTPLAPPAAAVAAPADRRPPVSAGPRRVTTPRASVRLRLLLGDRRGTAATLSVRIVNVGRAPATLLVDYGGEYGSPVRFMMDGGHESLGCRSGGGEAAVATLAPGGSRLVRCGRYELGLGQRMRARYDTTSSLDMSGRSLARELCAQCWEGTAESPEIVLGVPDP